MEANGHLQKDGSDAVLSGGLNSQGPESSSRECVSEAPATAEAPIADTASEVASASTTPAEGSSGSTTIQQIHDDPPPPFEEITPEIQPLEPLQQTGSTDPTVNTLGGISGQSQSAQTHFMAQTPAVGAWPVDAYGNTAAVSNPVEQTPALVTTSGVGYPAQYQHIGTEYMAHDQTGSQVSWPSSWPAAATYATTANTPFQAYTQPAEPSAYPAETYMAQQQHVQQHAQAANGVASTPAYEPFQFTRLVGSWPPPYGGFGKKIAEAEMVQGNVRHDILVTKDTLGTMWGPGNPKQRDLINRTGANIYGIEREAPPGYGPEQRLIVLVGGYYQVSAALAEILALLQQPHPPNLPNAQDAQVQQKVLQEQQQKQYQQQLQQLAQVQHYQPQQMVQTPQPQTMEVPGMGTFTRLVGNWPPPFGGFGKKILQAEGVLGNVRHDMLVHQTVVGKLIGSGGIQHKELAARTGCEMYVIGKEPPPGHPPDQRLVVLVGTPLQVTYAAHEVVQFVSRTEQRQPKRDITALGGYNYQPELAKFSRQY